MDDLYSPRSQSRTQPNYYTVDTSVPAKYSTQSHILSHALPPIKELSVNDLTTHTPTSHRVNNCYIGERSTTPTTDSAINMSRSSSSSEDESYQDQRSSSSTDMLKVADRVKHIMHQQSETKRSENSSSDSTLKSASSVISATALSPVESQKVFLSKKHHTNTASPTVLVGERLAPATDRQLSANHIKTHHQSSHYAAMQKPQPKTLAGTEMELEIVFPVSECL